jgi:hypothetical protein
MNWDIALKAVAVTIPVALALGAAFRNRPRPTLLVTRGMGKDFSQERDQISNREVLGIQVVNKGPKPFALAATNPLRLDRADGSVMPIPDEKYAGEWGPGPLTYTYRRPADGRLGEHADFVVVIPHGEWLWMRVGGTPPVVAVRLVDVTGRVRATRKLPRRLADWFNQFETVKAVEQERDYHIERAVQARTQDHE